jgi:Protein of unknown function (DUF998)
MAAQTASPGAPTRQTTRLLACGIVAGPLFLAAWLIQAFTRDGFDPTRHPLSLLSLGELGWIQIANFVVTGVLYLACAVGMWRVLHPGRSGTWGPLLVGGFGLGLILAGIFTTDPGAGFPPGAPAGAPEQLSWHGVLHEAGFVVAVVSWAAVCFVLVRRFVALKQWGWVGAGVATPLAVLVLASWPDPDSLSLRLVIASAIQFGFIAAVAARLRGGLPDAEAAFPAARHARRLKQAA